MILYIRYICQFISDVTIYVYLVTYLVKRRCMVVESDDWSSKSGLILGSSLVSGDGHIYQVRPPSSSPSPSWWLVAVLPDSRGRVVLVLVGAGGIAPGVAASCSPFKVDPRQSAGQARGARPPAGMCTRQEEEEEEEDQEEGEGEGGGAEKRAGALCFAFVLPSCPRLQLPHRHPTISSRGAQGRQQAGAQLSLSRVQKPDSFIAKVSS